MRSVRNLLLVGFAVLAFESASAQNRPAAAQTAPSAAPAAQATPPAAPAVPGEPQLTTAAFGDWLLRCSREGEGAQATRVCEVVQSIQAQGQQGALAQIAIGRLRRGDPLRMTTVLPANVSFPSSVRVSVDDRDNQPLELAWRRCVGGGCFADGEPSAAVLQRYRGQTGAGRIQFRDAGGRDIVIPISFRGLAQALDALGRES